MELYAFASFIHCTLNTSCIIVIIVLWTSSTETLFWQICLAAYIGGHLSLRSHFDKNRADIIDISFEKIMELATSCEVPLMEAKTDFEKKTTFVT